MSILNRCEYSPANHRSNAKHLIADDDRADTIKAVLDDRSPAVVFGGRDLAQLQYAEKLTLRPGEIEETDIIRLRENGLDDGEILEANQIICYFNYINRSLNGLGVTTENDIVGFYAKAEE